MIDWDQIHRLRSEVAQSDFHDILRLSLDQLEQAGAALRDTDPAADDAVEARLHFLKGTALTLGFETLAALCQKGESRAAAGQAAQIDMNAILNTLETTRARFVAGVAALQSGNDQIRNSASVTSSVISRST